MAARFHISGRIVDEHHPFRDWVLGLGKPKASLLCGAFCIAVSMVCTYIPTALYNPEAVAFALIMAASMPALLAPTTTWMLMTVLEKVADAEARQRELVEELQAALEEVKTLKGMLPICASCKNMRNDDGYWQSVESFISQRTDAEFSHSLCPECVRELYPDIADAVIKETAPPASAPRPPMDAR